MLVCGLGVPVGLRLSHLRAPNLFTIEIVISHVKRTLPRALWWWVDRVL